MDELTLPFVQVLLKRIEETPGADYIMFARMKAEQQEFNRQQEAAFASLPRKKKVTGKNNG